MSREFEWIREMCYSILAAAGHEKMMRRECEDAVTGSLLRPYRTGHV